MPIELTHRRWVGLLATLLLPTGVTIPAAEAQAGSWELFAGEPGCGRVAMIFNVGMDDEPHPEVTDGLAASGIPATIFPMGWWARTYPGLLQTMANQGFAIGNHGDQGIPLTTRADWEAAQDIRDADWAIESALGYPPVPYFTPFAADRDYRLRAIVAAESYTAVGWGVSAGDWTADASPMSVYTRVMADVYDGAIVEFHLDGPNTTGSTAIALPWIISDLAAMGYTFVTVPDLLASC